MSSIKLYLIKYEIPALNRVGIATVTASSPKQAQDYLQAQGKYNGYKYDMNYPTTVHTTDTWTAAAIISEIDNPVGEKGDRGPQGPKGDKGDKGDQGDPMTWEKMDPEDKMTFKEDVVADIESEIKTKYYPDMTVGKADNLVGRGDVQDAYINFRPSAGADNITDSAARIKRIKGNSVVYNQVMPTTNATLSTSPISSIRENGIVTCNGTTKPTGSGGIPLGQFVANDVGHKYLWLCNIISNEGDSVEGKMFILSNRSGFSTSTMYIKEGFAWFVYENTEAESSKGRGVSIVAGNNFVVTNLKVRVRQIDLSQMFGTGNEPTSYEAYLQRKPMNIKDEYDYNAGTLVDMKVESLVSVGDNAWDEEWENGVFDTTTGSNINAANRLTQIRSKNLIKVLPNTNYTCTIPAKIGNDSIWCMLLDKDKEVITGYRVPNAAISGNSFGLKLAAPSFTTPANAAYLKFYCTAVYGDVYTNDICFHLEHSEYKNGKYYPYQQNVKDLSFISEAFPNGMRSAGSAFDEIRFNPTKKEWEKVTRIGVAANLTFINGGENLFAVSIADSKWPETPEERTKTIFSNKYAVSKNVAASLMDDKSMLQLPQKNNIYIKDSAYATVAEFNEANKDLVIYYELAEPIVEPIDLSPNFNPDYLVWDFGTEEAIASVPSAPFRADINYEPNAVDDLRWAVAEIRKLKEQLAQIQSLTTNIE